MPGSRLIACTKRKNISPTYGRESSSSSVQPPLWQKGRLITCRIPCASKPSGVYQMPLRHSRMGNSETVKEKNQRMKDGFAYRLFVYTPNRFGLDLDSEVSRSTEHLSRSSCVHTRSSHDSEIQGDPSRFCFAADRTCTISDDTLTHSQCH